MSGNDVPVVKEASWKVLGFLQLRFSDPFKVLIEAKYFFGVTELLLIGV